MRDATQLARLLRAGELTGIDIPCQEREALRDLTRAREDAVGSRMKARQRLCGMLLRHDVVYSNGKSWTKRHRQWLAGVRWEFEAQRTAFEDYVRAVEEADERVARLTRAVEDCSSTHHDATLIRALQGLRGVSVVTAATLVGELGDMTRFDHPGQLMAFVGLVPSEHSSGERRRRGRITRTGNCHARRVLTEAAWNHRFPARVSRLILKRQDDLCVPEEIRAIAFKAQARLCHRYRKLTLEKKDNRLVVTAVAREMLGFVWSIAKEVKRLETKRS